MGRSVQKEVKREVERGRVEGVRGGEKRVGVEATHLERRLEEEESRLNHKDVERRRCGYLWGQGEDSKTALGPAKEADNREQCEAVRAASGGPACAEAVGWPRARLHPLAGCMARPRSRPMGEGSVQGELTRAQKERVVSTLQGAFSRVSKHARAMGDERRRHALQNDRSSVTEEPVQKPEHHLRVGGRQIDKPVISRGREQACATQSLVSRSGFVQIAGCM